MKTKMNDKNRLKMPSIWQDILISILYTIMIVEILLLVYINFGSTKKVDPNVASFYGAILALSGLMAKQYMFREAIDCLKKWIEIEKLLETIKGNSNEKDTNVLELLAKLADQIKLTKKYESYIKTELKIVPMIPIVLVVLYGAALIADESQLISMTCLGLMLLSVTYLAKATISSTSIPISISELEETINLLLDLRKNVEVVQEYKKNS